MHIEQTRFPKESALVLAVCLVACASASHAYPKADEAPGYRKVVVAKFEHRNVADLPKATVPDREDVNIERPIRKKTVPKLRHAEVPEKRKAPDREP